jgi:hypothetical protein
MAGEHETEAERRRSQKTIEPDAFHLMTPKAEGQFGGPDVDLSAEYTRLGSKGCRTSALRTKNCRLWLFCTAISA